jgi:transposase
MLLYPSYMEGEHSTTDPARMAEMMLGIPAVSVLDVEEDAAGLRIEVETKALGAHCRSCGQPASPGEPQTVERPGLAVFGRPVTLLWNLRQWCCVNPQCSTDAWFEEIPEISRG